MACMGPCLAWQNGQSACLCMHFGAAASPLASVELCCDCHNKGFFYLYLPLLKLFQRHKLSLAVISPGGCAGYHTRQPTSQVYNSADPANNDERRSFIGCGELVG